MANSRERLKLLRQAERELIKLTKELQTKFLKKLVSYFNNNLRFRDGVLVSQAEDFAFISSSPIYDRLYKQMAGEVARLFNRKLQDLERLTVPYFRAFEKNDFEAIRNQTIKDFRRLKNDYLQNYAISNEFQKSIRKKVLSLAQNGVTFQDFRGDLRDFVTGTEQKLGVAENFNFVKQRIQDGFAEFDRSLQNKFASRLDLNYAIYQGGEIKTTRGFCDTRNGKVYTREEILSWQNENWRGKKDNHNILIDCGGYNCRHYYDWISYELAKQQRKNISKSVFDTE